MLVLTRKARETVRIGADVRVTVLAVSGGQVRLGIEAPGNVVIHREEVFSQIESANRRAAQVDLSEFSNSLERLSAKNSGTTDGTGEEDES